MTQVTQSEYSSNMQTFLPYADFNETAKVLDYKRLGKQRVEAYQILRVLEGLTKGWRNHPAVLMWAGHEPALAEYGRVICIEWIERGYNDTLLPKFELLANADNLPAWLGDERLHTSHKSNLIRKDETFYAPKFPGIPNDLPYFWVVTKG